MGTDQTSSLMSNYGRMDVVFTHGKGTRLYDSSGKEYFDGLSGIAVCGLGHAHPHLTDALAEQAGLLVHTSNLYRIPLQEKLGGVLCGLSGLEKTFFCNSGAEANEAAIKIARKYGREKGIEEPCILVMHNSFHGRTMATLSATGNPKVHAGFEPLVDGFEHVPYDDLSSAERLLERREVVAVLVEPVQGEGGVIVPTENYLAGLETICRQHEALLMLDEVQTGVGRTGEWFAFQHGKVSPDVVTVAKALGNGVPIGACMAKGAASEILQPGTHGSTFGGNPLASRAALAVIDTMESSDLVGRARTLGTQIISAFVSRIGNLEGVVKVRGKGLMIGLELDRKCTELVGAALAEGLLLNVTTDKVVRLLPPLIMTDSEAEELVDRVSVLIKKFLS
jgi:acetylornithine/N-succinyldiaminopimelate aminotransferase